MSGYRGLGVPYYDSGKFAEQYKLGIIHVRPGVQNLTSQHSFIIEISWAVKNCHKKSIKNYWFVLQACVWWILTQERGLNNISMVLFMYEQWFMIRSHNMIIPTELNKNHTHVKYVVKPTRNIRPCIYLSEYRKRHEPCSTENPCNDKGYKSCQNVPVLPMVS